MNIINLKNRSWLAPVITVSPYSFASLPFDRFAKNIYLERLYNFISDNAIAQINIY